MRKNLLNILAKENPKVYFGHPTNTYNTQLEQDLIKRIKEFLPEYTIENPNQGHHQVGYKNYKHKIGNGMLYYYNEVLPACDAGVFLAFRDGMFGAGVWGESQYLSTQRKPVWEITPNREIFPLDWEHKARKLTIEETREYLKHDY